MGKENDGGGGSGARDPRLQPAAVRLLDGTTQEYQLKRGSEGDVLFLLVTRNLSIEEREYFSLCFYDNEGTRHWLYNDKKILRQLKGLPWEFSFEVKFYPTMPAQLNDDYARYHLFLQLRRDIVTGRLPASVATHALLGALAAQSEFGDAAQTDEYNEFMRKAQLAPAQAEGDVLAEKMRELHREQKGLTPGEAEMRYLDVCRQLAMYGVFLFDAKDSKGTPVSIGVSAAGINIYRDAMRVHRFSWQSINKISYRKSNFAVKLNPTDEEPKCATVVYKMPDYVHAKRTWKCAVEHHTFFRLIQPDEKPKPALFHFGSQRFRYQGRTQFQTKMASQMFDRPASVAAGGISRTPSQRMAAARSLDNVAKEPRDVSGLGDSTAEESKIASPSRSYHLHDASKGSKRAGGDDHDYDGREGYASATEENGGSKEKKSKKHSKGKENRDDETSSASSDDERHVVMVQREERVEQENGQPHTTVSTWQERSARPDEVSTEVDDKGNTITRTVKTQQVKHTVQRQTFQNFVLPVGYDQQQAMQLEHSREQTTPLQQGGSGGGGGGAGVMETHSRTVAYEAAVGPPHGQSPLGEFVSSKTVTSGNRTVETITYRTEKDGIVETHVEHRVTIHAADDIDHDAELSAAILEATRMNPDMTVEKIEVKQESTSA